MDGLTVMINRIVDERVVIRVQPHLSAIQDAVRIDALTALPAMEAVFDWFPDATSVWVEVRGTFTDSLSTRTDALAWLLFRRYAVVGFDYAGMRVMAQQDPVAFFCTVTPGDRYIRSVVLDKLRDTGCFH